MVTAHSPPLLPMYGALRDREDVRRDELARLAERLAPSHRPSRELARRGAFHAVGLGVREQAVTLLLGGAAPDGGVGAGGGAGGKGARESPLDAVEGERDALMACVVAGFVDPSMQHATIAAVAERFAAYPCGGA